VSRLVDLGIEPFLVASSVIGILGQRLVQRFCTFCAVLQAPSTELVEKMVALASCLPTDNGELGEAVTSVGRQASKVA